MYTYLQAKMEMLQNNTMDMEIRKLCRRFGIIENGMNINTASTAVSSSSSSSSVSSSYMQLYEVKRRFRSVVELSYMKNNKGKTGPDEGSHDNDDNHGGDNEDNNDQFTNSTGSTGSTSSGEEGHNLPIDEDEGKQQSTSGIAVDEENQLRNVIYEETFVQATSEPSDDNGHGGFLTPSLAKLIFQSGCATIYKNRDQSCRKKVDKLVKSIVHNSSDMQLCIESDRDALDKSEKYWTLHDVLSFGCNAVRGDFVDDGVENDTLLRFVFSTFLQVPKMNNQTAADVPRFVSIPSLKKLDDETQIDWSMTRHQVGYMLLLLMDHANYRTNADSPPKNNEEQQTIVQEASFEKLLKEQRFEDVTVDTSVALRLFGTLPTNSKTSLSAGGSSQVSLSCLVDSVFEDGLVDESGNDVPKENLYFQGFVRWCTNASTAKDKKYHESKFSRIGSLLLDLRLIASTLFGVKPSSPLLERTLIDEIFRRYSQRFPTSEVAKRGPPETVWYVIPSSWWRKWERYADNSSDIHNRPIISPIENNKLLFDNGSLALRPNLRNKQDFEVRNRS